MMHYISKCMALIWIMPTFTHTRSINFHSPSSEHVYNLILENRIVFTKKRYRMMLQMTKCISIFPFRLYLCKLIEMINRCAIAMFLKRYFDQKVRGRIIPSNRTDYKLNHRKNRYTDPIRYINMYMAIVCFVHL